MVEYVAPLLILCAIVILLLCFILKPDKKESDAEESDSANEAATAPDESNAVEIPYTPVAVKMLRSAYTIESIGQIVFYIMLAVGLIGAVALLVVGVLEENTMLIISAIAEGVLSVGAAFLEMFICNCVALTFRGQAEIIQNTHVTAMMAVRNDKRNSK